VPDAINRQPRSHEDSGPPGAAACPLAVRPAEYAVFRSRGLEVNPGLAAKVAKIAASCPLVQSGNSAVAEKQEASAGVARSGGPSQVDARVLLVGRRPEWERRWERD